MTGVRPPAFRPEIFDRTMKSLESGLTVGDIATYELASCGAADDVLEVLSRPELSAFDCIPVRRGERIVGVLERDRARGTDRVELSMRTLDESLLVSANEPLKGFIPLLVDAPHRLVVRGTRIEGIVTSSDVHKLPVRLLAFALITHLEMTMADLISRSFDGDDWLKCLTKSRRDHVTDKLNVLQTEKFDPPLLELTEFCDKRDILVKKGLLMPKMSAVAEMKRIEGLRNSLAHAATYAQSEQQFAEFVGIMELTESWITRLAASDGRSPQKD